MTGIHEYLMGDVENLVAVLLSMDDSEVDRLRVNLMDCARGSTRQRFREDRRVGGDPLDSFLAMASLLVSAEVDCRRDTLAAMEEDMESET